ncbi:MAG TPA: SurA N-terminal domain-containing protein [Blastocatellia bacterium]
MFRSTKILSLMLLVAASIVFASCDKNSDDPSSEVAARVGSKDITIKQIDSVIKQRLDAQGGGGSLSPAQIISARLTVLDKLIEDEALYQKAQKDNLAPDDAKVNQEIQKSKQSEGLTEEQYQEKLKKAGLTEQEVRDQIRRALAINALEDKEKTRVVQPTDSEIEKAFNENKEQFKKGRGVSLAVIVTDPVDNGAIDDAKSDAEAANKIKAIYEQLKSGSDFATIAQKRSEDTSALQSGNIGFFDEEQLKSQFATKLELPTRFMQMSAGQYTEPLNLGNRWYIFKVNEKQEQPRTYTLNDIEVRKSIIDAITKQRQDLLLGALRIVALQEANIKNYLAERIFKEPKTMVEMRPSALLESAQSQPQQRIENENKSAPASTANSNSSSK